MQSLFPLFKTVLDAHIQTKTTNNTFHKASEEFYSVLFDAYHTISEKDVDNSDIATDENKAIMDTYMALEDAKDLIEERIKGQNTVGMDNLLRGLYDRLESACGNARSFLREEEEEYK